MPKISILQRLLPQLSGVLSAVSVRETIKTAVNQGWGQENASALIKALELEAGVTVK
ncbi:hypothetical protein [Nostoc sp.]|uniref:hypothetical protein n=1 Tax=Nostoc sp. TaxID=1180 RepID=UPI002FF8FBF6